MAAVAAQPFSFAAPTPHRPAALPSRCAAPPLRLIGSALSLCFCAAPCVATCALSRVATAAAAVPSLRPEPLSLRVPRAAALRRLTRLDWDGSCVWV
jgi:hypothetical protein